MVDFSLTLEMTPTCHSERSEESQGLRSASGDGVTI